MKMIDAVNSQIGKVEPDTIVVDISSVEKWMNLKFDKDGVLLDFPTELSPWPWAWYEYAYSESATIEGERRQKNMVIEDAITIGVLVGTLELEPEEYFLSSADIAERYIDSIHPFANEFKDSVSVTMPLELEKNDGVRWLSCSVIIVRYKDGEVEPFCCVISYLDPWGALIMPRRIIALIPQQPHVPGAMTFSMFQELLLPVGMAQSLLSCKNVTVEDVPARPVFGATDRKGRKKKPETIYKTLVIDAMKKQARAEKGEGESEVQRALHICRGHFSTYTKEKPLFGHYVGTVWVPMHTRGTKEAGEVVKDYKIKRPKIKGDL